MRGRGLNRSVILTIVVIIESLLLVVLVMQRSTSLFGTALSSTSIVDAAYTMLSNQLGTTVTRKSNSVFIWSQAFYSDTSLGCPQPGQTYQPVQTNGYRVAITYKSITYDYRSRDDGSGMFLCSSMQTGNPVTITDDGKVSEPVAFVDAVFADINTRFSVALDRTNSTYRYTYASYPDSSLGCPQPGVTPTNLPVFGWQIVVTPKTGGSYDYRGFDESHFWFCTK
jgi:hypothetical protein